MTNTEDLDDRLHIVEQDVRLLRGDMTAMRREMNVRFTEMSDRMDRRFTALEQSIDQRFNEAGEKMELIIEMLGKLAPRS